MTGPLFIIEMVNPNIEIFSIMLSVKKGVL